MQFFLMALVIFGRNWFHVITKGILSDICRLSFFLIRSILLSRLSLPRCWLINDEWYPVLWICFSFPWAYFLNLLDLNLFVSFWWFDCKLNNLSMILGVEILCEVSVVDEFFPVYIYIILYLYLYLPIYLYIYIYILFILYSKKSAWCMNSYTEQ